MGRAGWTAIPNRVLEALYAGNLNSLQLRAVLYLWRTTHGWTRNRRRLQSRNIPYQEWAANLNTHKGHVSTMLRTLENSRIIIREYQGKGKGYSHYRLNTDVESWTPVTQLVTATVTQSVTATVTESELNCYKIEAKLLQPHEGLPLTKKKDIKKDIKTTTPLTTPTTTEHTTTPSPASTTTPHLTDTTAGISLEELPVTTPAGKGKKRILDYLRSNGGSTLGDLSTELGLRYGTVQVYLNSLKRDSLVNNPERGHWRACGL